MRSHLKDLLDQQARPANRCWVDYAIFFLLTDQYQLEKTDKITKSKPNDNCVNFFEMNYKYKKKNRRKKEIAIRLEFGC